MMKNLLDLNEISVPEDILNHSYLTEIARKLLQTYAFLREVSNFDDFLLKVSKTTSYQYEKFKFFLKMMELSSHFSEVFVQKSAQVGATTFFSLYAIYQALIGRKVLFVSPTMHHFQTIFKVLSTVLEQLQIPSAKSRFERLISFITGGEIRFAYVSSLNTLRGYTAEIIFCDEAASYPQITPEGDPFEIIKARSLATKYFKLFAFSTPTTTTTKFSIEVENADKKYIAVVNCNRCSELFLPDIDKTEDEFHVCSNCQNRIPHSVESFCWKRVKNEKGSRISFFINVLTSPHTTLSRIREELKTTDISKQNLLLAKATETETFPVPKLSLEESINSDVFTIAADIGYDTVHLVRVTKFQDKFYVDFVKQLEPNHFLNFVTETNRIIYVDLGYFSDLKELKNSFKLESLNCIRGIRGLTTTSLYAIQRYPLTKWNESYFLINKQKAFYLLRNFILSEKFLLSLSIEQGQYIQKCFSKIRLLTGASGFQRWGYTDDEHDYYSHFVDAIVYAFALLYDGVKSVPVVVNRFDPDRNTKTVSVKLTEKFTQFFELV